MEMASVGTARAQFMRIYNAVFTREEERATNEAVLRMLTEKQREMLQRTDNVAKLVAGKMAIDARETAVKAVMGVND